jgi:hypothetical protein
MAVSKFAVHVTQKENKHMRLIISVVVVLLVLAALAPLSAAPSFRGYTGLVNIPTADTLSLGEFNAAAFTVNTEARYTVLAGNFGVLPGLEAGLANFDVEHASSKTALNLKYCFRGESMTFPQIAIGIADAADEIDQTPYLVVSKSLTPFAAREIVNFKAHAGIGGGLLSGLFVGASAEVAKKTTLMLEHDTDDLNLGVNYSFSPELTLHAGALNGLSDLGMGISFSKKL